MLPPDATDPLEAELISSIDRETTQFLESQASLARDSGAAAMLKVARSYVLGGKRLRPAFCYWGYVAAAGHPADPQPLIRAAASLDIFHASLLVHDDLIDRSERRRDQPVAHRQFHDHHQAIGGAGSSEEFGAAAAILAGAALMAWSVEMWDSSGLPAERLNQARGLVHTMRSEVLLGQYLDVAAAYLATEALTSQELLAQAEQILEYKSARYSIRRPLEIGAVLGGAAEDSELVTALGRYGSLVGGAFQLRDDILGVFGDPRVTGKPAGDDLREGKRTILVLEALARCDASQKQIFDEVLGNAEADDAAIDRVRSIITSTGAADVVEQLITERTAAALAVLDSVSLADQAHTALSTLAGLVTRRER